MIWTYNMATEPDEQEEVLVIMQDTISGNCSHALAWRVWAPSDEDPTVRILRWQSTCTGEFILPPFDVYGWSAFTQARDRGAEDVLLPVEEDKGEF